MTIVCDALGVDALSVLDVMRVERWTQLPGFTPALLRQLVQKGRKGRKISSAAYFERAVEEAFAAPLAPQAQPAHLLAERPWGEYLAVYITMYGSPDAGVTAWLQDRWRWQRQLLGFPPEETELEDSVDGAGLPGGDAEQCPLPLAA